MLHQVDSEVKDDVALSVLPTPYRPSDSSPPKDVSWHNENDRIFGCSHYSRRCYVSAPCCNVFFPCRLCHDEQTDHTMQRRSINRLSCMKCITNGRRNEQPVAAQCHTCQETFAAYFCAICRLFDDDASHDIQHCDQCGICRRGTAETLHHCNICGSCYPDVHTNSLTCVPNILQRNPCPVCLGECQESTLPVTVLACRHVIHLTCLHNYLRNEYTDHYVFSIPRCPLCLKSITIDVARDRVRARFIRQTPMPSEIAIKRIEIICNDCLTHFVASKNFIGYQCLNATCRSFNCGEICDLPDDTPITVYQPREGEHDHDDEHDNIINGVFAYVDEDNNSDDEENREDDEEEEEEDEVGDSNDDEVNSDDNDDADDREDGNDGNDHENHADKTQRRTNDGNDPHHDSSGGTTQ